MKNKAAPYILVVEDSDEDFEALRRVLKGSRPPHQQPASLPNPESITVTQTTSKLTSLAANEETELTIAIKRCVDGDEAMDFLDGRGDYQNRDLLETPSIILLDLNLPGSDGRDVLQHVKQHEQLKVVPVVILTTSSNPKDIQTCYQYGANTYLIKPMNIQQLKDSIGLLLDYWFKAAILPTAAVIQ